MEKQAVGIREAKKLLNATAMKHFGKTWDNTSRIERMHAYKSGLFGRKQHEAHRLLQEHTTSKKADAVMNKVEQVLDKEAAFTEHGKAVQEAQARAHSSIANAENEANAKYPGMAFLKGTYADAIFEKLHARSKAYRSKGAANSLKAGLTLGTFGLGPKGQEALNELETKTAGHSH